MSRSATPAEQLAAQLEHPTPQSVWNRALEVFADEAKARSWMDQPRELFGGRSPQDLVSCGSRADLRQILEILVRIDFGVFS